MTWQSWAARWSRRGRCRSGSPPAPAAKSTTRSWLVGPSVSACISLLHHAPHRGTLRTPGLPYGPGLVHTISPQAAEPAGHRPEWAWDADPPADSLGSRPKTAEPQARSASARDAVSGL